MKAGFWGAALTLAIASSNVAAGFGLAGRSQPRWLSEICAKVKPVAACAEAGVTPRICETLGTPPTKVQIRPVPAHTMHSRAPRRSIANSLRLSAMLVSCAKSVGVTQQGDRGT